MLIHPIEYSLQELEEDIAKINAELKEIRRRKGSDYSNQTDTLENVRVFGSFGVVVRMLDKLMRLKNSNGKACAVPDETILDTSLDLINYAYYFNILYKQELENERISRKKRGPQRIKEFDECPTSYRPTLTPVTEPDAGP